MSNKVVFTCDRLKGNTEIKSVGKMNFVKDQQQTQTLYNRSRFLNKSDCLCFSQVAQWSPECPTSHSAYLRS